MALRVKFDVEPEFVKPKIEDFVPETITFPDFIGMPSGVTPVVSDTDTPTPGDSPKGYDWFAFGISLSLEDIKQLNDGVKKLMEVIQKITKVMIALLKIFRLLSSDLKSVTIVLKFLIKVIVKQLKQIIESFASTGLYVSVIYPDFDPRQSKFSIPVNGGYREFISKVNVLCLNSKDKYAPRFFSEPDQVGGFILAMLGGSEDPEFLNNLITNFDVLARLFGFKSPLPSPAKDFRAVIGLFPNPEFNGELSPGVKLNWSHPGTPLRGFRLFRGDSPTGVPNGAIVGKNNEDIPYNRLSGSSGFDEEEDGDGIEFRAFIGKKKYEYIDFNVAADVNANVDNTYYYQVGTEASKDWLKNNPQYNFMSSPVFTKVVSAKPRRCIPLSALNQGPRDQMGNEVETIEGEWHALSLRKLLGPEVDNLFTLIDNMADKLTGMLVSTSQSANDYIKFFEEKIEFYMDIINKVAELIDYLMTFRLNGTFMCLSLSPKRGGMQGFVDRFNQATTSEDVKQFPSKSNDNKAGGISQYMDQGIMAGVILLYGIPDVNGSYFKEMVPPDKMKQVQKSFDKSQKALKVFLKLLGLEK